LVWPGTSGGQPTGDPSAPSTWKADAGGRIAAGKPSSSTQSVPNSGLAGLRLQPSKLPSLPSRWCWLNFRR
jgi:hypothetical protein